MGDRVSLLRAATRLVLLAGGDTTGRVANGRRRSRAPGLPTEAGEDTVTFISDDTGDGMVSSLRCVLLNPGQCAHCAAGTFASSPTSTMARRRFQVIALG